MLISKFDLYKSEWLELVFDDRNKEYGAYELRRHYGLNMLTAMCIAFLGVGATVFIIGAIIKPVVTQIVKPQRTIEVFIHKYVIEHPVVTPPRPISHVKLPHLAVVPVTPAAMHKFVPLVITTNPTAIDPPKMTELSKGAIGPAEIKALPGINTAPAPGEGTNTLPGTGTIYTEGIERMPEPVGGAAAWSKFLQKNLNYPDMAIDQHMQGKVWVSFIVERDGHLSNIKVDRGAGYGMDEEALRVLKLSPAWKPGIQNGQPVRVRYNIPINFQIQD